MARYGSTAGPPGSVLQERWNVEIAATLARRAARRHRRPVEVASRAAPAAAEPGGDDGHPDLSREPIVDGRSEDDVRVVGRGGADHLGGIVHLDERQVLASGDRE